jgi:hypothetical protein
MISHAATPDSQRRARILVVAAVVQLALSVVLLLVASTTTGRLPRCGGPVDVAVAFSLVLTLALLHRASADRVGAAALRASYRIATTLPAFVSVMLWVFRDRLIWNTLLPGLAWRSFVLLSALPLAFAAFERQDA